MLLMMMVMQITMHGGYMDDAEGSFKQVHIPSYKPGMHAF